MAADLQPDEDIWIPYRCVDPHLEGPRCVFQTKVLRMEERSVVANHPRTGGGEIKVAASFAHRRVGVAIIRIGDGKSEAGLLDPLAKSVLQFFRLLLSDDLVWLIEVRSLAELTKMWKDVEPMTSHVVLIAHGFSEGLTFLIDGDVSATQVLQAFPHMGGDPRRFISLACETGRNPFAGEFSAGEGVESFVAPYHSIHGALASQFCQAYYIHHVFDGRTSAPAYRWAKKSMPTGVNFTFWRDGYKEQGA